MDIISHIATANLGSLYISKLNPKISKYTIILGGFIPDIGEILIQFHLSQKYDVDFGVYDTRTSDLFVASQLSTTWLYDILHSPVLVLICFIISCYLPERFKYYWQAFGIGVFIHILLDFGTHGKVWALKLLFPFSDRRFPFFADSIGNWWDWTPKLSLPYVSYGFPIYNVIFIFFILSITFYLHKRLQK